MLIENAPVVRKKIRRQARFLIKFFKYINPIEILGKKGLQSEAKIHYLECTSEGELNDEELQKGINERTRLVAVAQVSNVLGCVNPLQKITEMAHRVGAVAIVDGAQSVPHMPIDVQALDADFLAFSGHKLMGPMGIGCLYGKRELTQRAMEGLGALPYVHILGSKDPANHTGIVSFTI